MSYESNLRLGTVKRHGLNIRNLSKSKILLMVENKIPSWISNCIIIFLVTYRVRSKEDNYQLNINGYTGNATDSLKTQNSSPFSTYDRQNDLKHPNVHSNTTIKSGWWYNRWMLAKFNALIKYWKLWLNGQNFCCFNHRIWLWKKIFA